MFLKTLCFSLKKIFFIPAASRGQGGPVPPSGQGVPAEGGGGDGKVFDKSLSLIYRKYIRENGSCTQVPLEEDGELFQKQDFQQEEEREEQGKMIFETVVGFSTPWLS